MGSGAVLLLLGVALILLDIRQEVGGFRIAVGAVESEISATYVGLVVVALGVALQIVGLLKSQSSETKRTHHLKSNKTRKAKKDDRVGGMGGPEDNAKELSGNHRFGKVVAKSEPEPTDIDVYIDVETIDAGTSTKPANTEKVVPDNGGTQKQTPSPAGDVPPMTALLLAQSENPQGLASILTGNDTSKDLREQSRPAKVKLHQETLTSFKVVEHKVDRGMLAKR